MSFTTATVKVYGYFEKTIVIALMALLMLIVLWSTWLMVEYFLTGLYLGVTGNPRPPHAIQAFVEHAGILRSVFGAFLLVLIGIELLKTIVAYLDHHEFHVEVVFTVAMIAIARHAVDLDLESTSPLLLVGMGTIVFALAASYYLYRRATGTGGLESTSHEVERR